MAAYISHMIMADDVFEKIGNEKISRNYLRTFSLGEIWLSILNVE